MAETKFRLFYNNKPASQEQLDRIEQITVEQEVDVAWEARIEILICLDSKGEWVGEDAEVVKSFARVRVEINNDGKTFVPLIDGPVVKHSLKISSQPGQSTITLVVRDDSIYLNRQDVNEKFEGMTDDRIIIRLFEDCEEIDNYEVESTPAAQTGLAYDQVQSETPIHIMRRLGRRHNKHVYVLPGANPGESIGCFKAFPTTPDGLPKLVLLGSESNLESFEVNKNAEKPLSVTAASIDVTNKNVISATANFQDEEMLGDDPALESDMEAGTRILHPWRVGSDYLEAAVASEAGRSAYAHDGSGKVRFGCYPGVLQPYRVVTIKAGKIKNSGDYILTKVTHTVNRSSYEQAFQCKRNAESSLSGGGSFGLGESIF